MPRPAQPKLDIELYIQNYLGRTRFDRLLFIGKTCVPLCVEALKAAVAEAKKASNIAHYQEAWESIRAAAPDEPEAAWDASWVERTEADNRVETARLESELKRYKSNMIKESIRMGNQDLGRHLESIGRLTEASDAYARMRQDATSTKHIVDCGIRLAIVSLQRKDWNMVISNVSKILNIPNADDNDSANAYPKILSGIAYMSMAAYATAAEHLLRADSSTSPAVYAEVASSNDVAIYGALTALATMDRRDLQLRVLDNQGFRIFLENEPHIRRAVSFFVNGRYASCLSILDAARPDYLLDIHLHDHLPTLYSRIRTKCIIQYFAPFSRVSIESLEAAFGRDGESIEPELIGMIRDGSLMARIDAKDRLLVAVRPDQRAEMQKEALEVARGYEEEAKERLRRINLVAAGLEIVGKANHDYTLGLRPSDALFDEDGRPLPAEAGAVESYG
ncbi:hypothetical protein RJ55_01145 [Drechmeria coniospora]|nr:hypothetical protein RJ55_01145 [Drechmeria coniospora]